jgi:translation initiation factor 2D
LAISTPVVAGHIQVSNMFKKKPQIKNLSPLRSSDRRKLADQIIAEYNVHVPTLEEIDSVAAETQPPPNQPTPALSSIRTSLVPETCLSARFTTHAGASLTLVSGTVYVGAHPGQEERILWIQYGKEPRIYPTVYTLWHNPGLTPLLHTQDFVVEKLRTGADLMTPGLVGGPPWPEAAKAGSVVAVAGLERPNVPIWVGTCKIDVSSLGRVQGAKGAAVEGIHWEGDEIWAWSQFGSGGRAAPDSIEGWDTPSADIEDRVEGLDLEDNDEDDDGQNGGVALDVGGSAGANGDNGSTDAPEADAEPEQEPTTAEVDDAFMQAFLYALYDSKKHSEPPHHGLDFPIQPSFLISNMIQPHLRFQNQHYTIKKTSWKNTKKFIKYLEKQALVKSKDRNGGETVILDIDLNDERVRNFAPYRLPKAKVQTSAASTEGNQTPASGADTSLGQKLALQTVYRASSKLVPDLIPSKTTYYTSSQISAFLKKYIENNPSLTETSSSSRFVKLDPFIANNILGSNPSASDTRVLAAGEISRDALVKRILEDSHLAIPHWLLLRNDQTYDPESPDPSLKPKSGPAPQVSIVLEKRSGTKVVTKISGLEVFGINPHVLAPELQKKCAGSASVGQHVGGKPGMMEILVQGDQRDVVDKELGRRGVDKRWITVDDKTKKKKK